MKISGRLSATGIKQTAFFFSGALLFQTCAAPLAEANFWAERRAQAKKTDLASSARNAPIRLASLPNPLSNAPAMERIMENVGGTTRPEISSPLAVPLREELPPAFQEEHAALFEALSFAHGQVRNIALPRGKPTGKIIVHIQDIHLNTEAQENIGRAIESLIDKKKTDLVALEGAFAPLREIDDFRSLPARKDVKAAADHMLGAHKISGAVHAALSVDNPIPAFIGVDDDAHYRANVDAYKRSAPLAAEYKAEWSRMNRRLAETKARVFRKKLLDFDEKIQAYRNGALPFGGYARLLADNAEEPSPAARIFLSALKMESELDFKDVERERAEVIRELSLKLNRTQLNGLLQQSLAYRMGHVRYGDFYGFVRRLCRGNGVSLEKFPSMEKYIAYVILSDGINAEELFRDLRRMEKNAYGRLAETAEEKTLIEDSITLHAIGKLLDFALIPQEWEEYRAAAEEAGRPPRSTLSTFPLDLSSFEAFYREANARDVALADNVRNAMRERNSRVAVVVTGGFHSESLQERLRAQGDTVITFTPKISKVDETESPSYLSVFTQEKTPLDRLFEGRRLFLSPLQFAPEGNRRETALIVTALAGTPEEARARFRHFFGNVTSLLRWRTLGEAREVVLANAGKIMTFSVLLAGETVRAVEQQPLKTSAWGFALFAIGEILQKAASLSALPFLSLDAAAAAFTMGGQGLMLLAALSILSRYTPDSRGTMASSVVLLGAGAFIPLNAPISPWLGLVPAAAAAILVLFIFAVLTLWTRLNSLWKTLFSEETSASATQKWIQRNEQNRERDQKRDKLWNRVQIAAGVFLLVTIAVKLSAVQIILNAALLAVLFTAILPAIARKQWRRLARMSLVFLFILSLRPHLEKSLLSEENPPSRTSPSAQEIARINRILDEKRRVLDALLDRGESLPKLAVQWGAPRGIPVVDSPAEITSPGGFFDLYQLKKQGRLLYAVSPDRASYDVLWDRLRIFLRTGTVLNETHVQDERLFGLEEDPSGRYTLAEIVAFLNAARKMESEKNDEVLNLGEKLLEETLLERDLIVVKEARETEGETIQIYAVSPDAMDVTIETWVPGPRADAAPDKDKNEPPPHGPDAPSTGKDADKEPTPPSSDDFPGDTPEGWTPGRSLARFIKNIRSGGEERRWTRQGRADARHFLHLLRLGNRAAVNQGLDDIFPEIDRYRIDSLDGKPMTRFLGDIGRNRWGSSAYRRAFEDAIRRTASPEGNFSPSFGQTLSALIQLHQGRGGVEMARADKTRALLTFVTPDDMPLIKATLEAYEKAAAFDAQGAVHLLFVPNDEALRRRIDGLADQLLSGEARQRAGTLGALEGTSINRETLAGLNMDLAQWLAGKGLSPGAVSLVPSVSPGIQIDMTAADISDGLLDPLREAMRILIEKNLPPIGLADFRNMIELATLVAQSA